MVALLSQLQVSLQLRSLKGKNTLNIKEKIQRLKETMREQSVLAAEVKRELDRALESVMVAGVRVERIGETTLLVRLPTVQLIDWLSSRETETEQELESSSFNRVPTWRPVWGEMRNGTSFPQLSSDTCVICGIAFAYKFQWFVTDGTRMLAWGFAKADAAAAAAEELNRVLLASPR